MLKIDVLNFSTLTCFTLYYETELAFIFVKATVYHMSGKSDRRLKLIHKDIPSCLIRNLK